MKQSCWFRHLSDIMSGSLSLWSMRPRMDVHQPEVGLVARWSAVSSSSLLVVPVPWDREPGGLPLCWKESTRSPMACGVWLRSRFVSWSRWKSMEGL